MQRLPLSTARDAQDAFVGFPSTLVAVAARADGKPTGMLASSFTAGVSFDPPMAAFSVQNRSATWPVLRRARGLGITLLAHGQEGAALQLSSRRLDRFAGPEITDGDDDAVFIGGGVYWLAARIEAEIPAGDHTLVVLVLTAAHRQDAAPLIYRDRHFTTVPTHAAA